MRRGRRERTRARAIVPNAIARDDVIFAIRWTGEAMGITKPRSRRHARPTGPDVFFSSFSSFGCPRERVAVVVVVRDATAPPRTRRARLTVYARLAHARFSIARVVEASAHDARVRHLSCPKRVVRPLGEGSELALAARRRRPAPRRRRLRRRLVLLLPRASKVDAVIVAAGVATAPLPSPRRVSALAIAPPRPLSRERRSIRRRDGDARILAADMRAEASRRRRAPGGGGVRARARRRRGREAWIGAGSAAAFAGGYGSHMRACARAVARVTRRVVARVKIPVIILSDCERFMRDFSVDPAAISTGAPWQLKIFIRPSRPRVGSRE